MMAEVTVSFEGGVATYSDKDSDVFMIEMRGDSVDPYSKNRSGEFEETHVRVWHKDPELDDSAYTDLQKARITEVVV